MHFRGLIRFSSVSLSLLLSQTLSFASMTVRERYSASHQKYQSFFNQKFYARYCSNKFLIYVRHWVFLSKTGNLFVGKYHLLVFLFWWGVISIFFIATPLRICHSKELGSVSFLETKYNFYSNEFWDRKWNLYLIEKWFFNWKTTLRFWSNSQSLRQYYHCQKEFHLFRDGTRILQVPLVLTIWRRQPSSSAKSTPKRVVITPIHAHKCRGEYFDCIQSPWTVN